MFENADIVVKAVMIGLAFASIVTWTIFLAKGAVLIFERRRAIREHLIVTHAADLEETIVTLNSSKGVVALLARSFVDERKKSRGLPTDGVLTRADTNAQRLSTRQARRIGSGIGFLATIGATAPFVGLFGTVWGIMDSFIGISKSHATNLAIVAPGIAEALLATACGLVAAIPAVMIYNLFARAIADFKAQVADSIALLNIRLSRELDRKDALASNAIHIQEADV